MEYQQNIHYNGIPTEYFIRYTEYLSLLLEKPEGVNTYLNGANIHLAGWDVGFSICKLCDRAISGYICMDK